MSEKVQLYMMLLGGRPKGRLTEQHDIFFSVGANMLAVVPYIKAFWPEIKSKIHVDAYRAVNFVDGYRISVAERSTTPLAKALHLFFINLGGYTAGVFDEAHHKVLVVAADKAEAIRKVKASAFFKTFDKAHVDDKYGLDIDDLFDIEEVLPAHVKAKWQLVIEEHAVSAPDEIVLGYMPLHTFG